MSLPTPRKRIRKQFEQSLLALCCAFSGAGLIGCRQRAYTELYVENMAGEIRMLEDRVYEYDAAYVSLEQEVEELKQRNERLKSQIGSGINPPLNYQENSSRNAPSLKLKDSKTPSNSSGSTQSKKNESPSVLIPNSDPETLENPPPVIRTPSGPPPLKDSPLEDMLPPASKLPTSAQPEASNQRTRPRNSSLQTQRTSPLPSDDSLNEQVTMPDSMVRSAQQPRVLITPPEPIKLPTNDSESTKPAQPTLLQGLPRLQNGNHHGSSQRDKIKLPEGSKIQLASATEPVESIPTVIQDQKVAAIAFHPTLCRGHNFDDKPGDDGLYLVITPLNQANQVLTKTGTLTVVVEDRAIKENHGRVAAWVIEPEQLKEMLEPVGTAQGFHLSLPWKDIHPTSSTVSVYLLFEDEEGRKLVKDREIRLRTPTSGQSVWTPRKTD